MNSVSKKSIGVQLKCLKTPKNALKLKNGILGGFLTICIISNSVSFNHLLYLFNLFLYWEALVNPHIYLNPGCPFDAYAGLVLLVVPAEQIAVPSHSLL